MNPRDIELTNLDAEKNELACKINSNNNISNDNDSTSTRSSTNKWRKRLGKFVQPDMIATKITYFFWGGLIGTFYVYLYPFYVALGISESKAGIITGNVRVRILSFFIAPP